MTQALSILFMIAAVLGVTWIVLRPKWAVLLVLLMFPLEQLLVGYFQFFMDQQKFFNIMVGLLALLAFMSRFVRGNVFAGAFNGVAICLMSLAAYAWVTLLWSPVRDEAFTELWFAVPYVILMLGMGPLLIEDTLVLQDLVVGLMLTGSIVAILVFLNPEFNFTGGRFVLDVAGNDRTGNPLAIASMGGTLAIASALLKVDRGSRLLLALRIFSLVCGFGLAIGSGSRGQVLAAVLVILVFFPFSREVRNLRQFVVMSGAGLLVGAVIYTTFRVFIADANESRWDLEGMALASGGRYEMIVAMLEAYAGSPGHYLQGLGIGAFREVAPSGVEYPHNIVAEVIGETGVIGFTLLTLASFMALRAGRQLFLAVRDDPRRRSGAAIVCALAAYAFLLTLKQGSVLRNPAMLMWWMILGRIAANEVFAARVRAEEYWDEHAHGDEDELASDGYDASPAMN